MTFSVHLSLLCVLLGNTSAFHTPHFTSISKSSASSLSLNPTDLAHVDEQTVNSVFSSLTAASSAFAAKSSFWSYLPLPWVHVDHNSIYATGKSLPPIDPDAVSGSASAVKDYFIPTESESAARDVLENYLKAKQVAGGELPSSSEFIKIDAQMPGAAAKNTGTTYKINPEITKREIEYVARETDIIMRKIPQAAIIYGLLDFFVLPASKEVMSDELEDDRVGVTKEFAFRASIRLGVFIAIAFATILVENLTYHPV